MQSTALFGVAFLLCASAAGTPAQHDSAADKDNGSAAASTDLERKGEAAAAQRSGPPNATASGRKDTQGRRDADTDTGQGSGEVDGEFGPEGIKPK
jgi:hypothetical protein